MSIGGMSRASCRMTAYVVMAMAAMAAPLAMLTWRMNGVCCGVGNNNVSCLLRQWRMP